jgi:hypothetical protein
MPDDYMLRGLAATPQNQKNRSRNRALKNRAEREARALRKKYERTLAEKHARPGHRVNGVWVHSAELYFLQHEREQRENEARERELGEWVASWSEP